MRIGDPSPPARPSAAGERLGPDDIWVSRVERKDLTSRVLAPGRQPLDTDLLHGHLLGRPPCPGPATRGPDRGETGSGSDTTNRHRGRASPEGVHAGGIFGAPPAGTAVPAGRGGARRCRRDRRGGACGCGSGAAGVDEGAEAVEDALQAEGVGVVGITRCCTPDRWSLGMQPARSFRKTLPGYEPLRLSPS